MLLAYGNAGRLADVERVLDELRQLQQARPEDAKVAWQLAKGLTGALVLKGGDPTSLRKDRAQLVEEFKDTEGFAPIVELLGRLGPGRTDRE